MSEKDKHVDDDEGESAEYVITTNAGHKVRCRASQGMRDVVGLVVSIDGILHTYGDTRSDGSSLHSEARSEAETVAAMLDAGMIRRKGNDWEVARNAQLPAPDGWVAVWKE